MDDDIRTGLREHCNLLRDKLKELIDREDDSRRGNQMVRDFDTGGLYLRFDSDNELTIYTRSYDNMHDKLNAFVHTADYRAVMQELTEDIHTVIRDALVKLENLINNNRDQLLLELANEGTAATGRNPRNVKIREAEEEPVAA